MISGAAAARMPSGCCALLVAADFAQGPVHELALVGEIDDPTTRALLEVVRRRYLPHRAVALAAPNAETEGLALLADKMDVTEELVRLGAHIERARELLQTGGETGKRLDFLVQEMAREANTLGAKARGVDVAEPLVEMKAEIEKIREQARNLE